VFTQLIFTASLGSCDPQLERHQGRQILDGLTNVALRLLTPHGDNHDGKIRLDDQVHANAHRLQELKASNIRNFEILTEQVGIRHQLHPN
jgi:hypothetical protein